MNIYQSILSKKTDCQKQLAVLLDPDKALPQISSTIRLLNECRPDLLLIGGSLTLESTDLLAERLKAETDLPLLLFPGNACQFTAKTDALLYLTLLSGRNADFLIGQHVTSAHHIKKSGREVISTGYILIDGGKISSVQYISNTMPIPNDKPEIAVSTAIAGELLGNKLIYLEAGSGAINPVPENMIRSVRQNIDIPLIVGGGIRNGETLRRAFEAGADIAVVGNILEKSPETLREFIQTTREFPH